MFTTFGWVLVALLACATGAHAQAEGFRLESVESRPADPAVDLVVERLLPLQPGDSLTPEVLVELRERLQNSGYFEQLQLYTARGSAPGRVVLVVEAQLDRGAHFETGFGYQPLDGWYLNLAGVRWNSPLRHAGFISVVGRLGLRTRGLYADWFRPSGSDHGLDLLMHAHLGSRDWIAWIDDTQFRQNIARSRLEIGLGLGAHTKNSAVLWLGFVGSDPDSVLDQFGGSGQISGVLPAVGQLNQVVGHLDLSRDRRDDRLNPRRGSYLGGRIFGGVVEGEQAYVRIRGDARRFLSIPGRSVVALRAAGAWVSADAPYFERLMFGGYTKVMMRGFPDASLSGPLGARAYWNVSAEVRRPLSSSPDPRVEGILFLDTGQHWDAAGDRANTSWGIGYGLRIRVPWVQRFGIDVGIPLTPSPTGDPFWVYLTLGHSF